MRTVRAAAPRRPGCGRHAALRADAARLGHRPAHSRQLGAGHRPEQRVRHARRAGQGRQLPPIAGREVGGQPGRQDLHLHPAQGRQVPRRHAVQCRRGRRQPGADRGPGHEVPEGRLPAGAVRRQRGGRRVHGPHPAEGALRAAAGRAEPGVPGHGLARRAEASGATSTSCTRWARGRSSSSATRSGSRSCSSATPTMPGRPRSGGTRGRPTSTASSSASTRTQRPACPRCWPARPT